MLFETVYGPELQRVHAVVQRYGPNSNGMTYDDIYLLTVPGGVDGQTKNVQDALSFLRSARMVTEDNGALRAVEAHPFRPGLLRSLRSIQGDENAPPLDRTFMGLVEDLYILPNRLFRVDPYGAANQVSTLPVSQERINAWARILEYLGLGRRVAGGFQCAYQPNLVREILQTQRPGIYELETFLEEAIDPYLPSRTRDGEIALSLWTTFDSLRDSGEMRLTRIQDSPARRFGSGEYTHLRLRSQRRRAAPTTLTVAASS